VIEALPTPLSYPSFSLACTGCGTHNERYKKS
jgi:hypothetical protein